MFARRVPILCCLALAGAWLALYLLRLRDHFANVDDYLYAQQTVAYRHGAAHGPTALAHAWRAYSANSPLVPALASPLAIASRAPNVLLLVQLPILAALIGGLVCLGSALGLSHRHRWITALAIGLTPAVLGYAVMLHFALAAAAAAVWAVACYLRSDRLRERRWAIALGVAAGLLVDTRVVALVYVAALALVIVIDMALERSAAGWANLALASGVGIVIAAPWWIVCGRSAIRYLLTAGYNSSSGFAPASGVFDKIRARALSLVDLTGLVELLLLAALLVAWLAWRRDRASAFTAAVGALMLLGLASSSNPGTAFELPAVALLAVVASMAVRSRWLATTVAVALVVGLATQYALFTTPTLASHPTWVQAYPARQQADRALGRHVDLTRFQHLNADVADSAGDRPTLLVRDDALVNGVSLHAARPSLRLAGLPFGAQTITAAELGGIHAVIAGTSDDCYHARIDLAALPALLTANGFRPTRTFQLTADNSVVVWSR